jgi:hypothetical protein
VRKKTLMKHLIGDSVNPAWKFSSAVEKNCSNIFHLIKNLEAKNRERVSEGLFHLIKCEMKFVWLWQMFLKIFIPRGIIYSMVVQHSVREVPCNILSSTYAFHMPFECVWDKKNFFLSFMHKKGTKLNFISRHFSAHTFNYNMSHHFNHNKE